MSYKVLFVEAVKQLRQADKNGFTELNKIQFCFIAIIKAGVNMAVLVVLIAFFGAANTFLTKKFQISFTFSPQSFLWYNFINAIVATFTFYIICGFKVQFNSTTFLFSLGYAGISFCSLCFGVAALSILPIPVSSVLSSSGALLLGSLAGILFFKERANVFTILSILIALTACMLPFSNHSKGDFSFKKIIICVLYFLNCGISSIYMKLYVTNPNTSSANQLFFFTNLFLVVISFVGILGTMRIKKIGFKSIITVFGPIQIINISARTVLNNISSVISATVIALIPLATYNIIMPTLSMLATLSVSLLIFKERLKARQITAFILMLVASLLCNF